MKRIFAFLLLLAVGFYVLHELVGDELVATGRPTAVEPGDEGSDPPEQRGRAGVDLRQGSFGATAEQRGELQLPRFREVRQPDGTIVKQMVFVLHAQDSRPIRDGMQQLDGVEATLFDDGEAGAVIRADRAFVELGRDKNGAPSFEANKEISMSRVTFEALPGSRLDGLRITLEEARALIDETELHIYTPREDVPAASTEA